MKCDLHVHSIHPGPCTSGLLRFVCRESYSDPLELYHTLKRRGMGLVTLTDHDAIDGSEALRRFPDFFTSEEVTCRLPSGTEAHIGVYDITERQHIGIQRRRGDLIALLMYLTEQRLFFSINHAFSGLTGRRELEDFDWFEDYFPAIETRNGHLPARNNSQARRLAREHGKIALGGSDAHALPSAGTAYTEVPGATSKEEFFEGLRRGEGRVRGEHGSYRKLARDVYLIAGEMMRLQPWKALLAPLAVLVPAITFVNFLCELSFARVWGARVMPELRARERTPLWLLQASSAEEPL